MAAIEKAIRDSDLGVNPTNDGNIIRVVFPQLTEERRKEFIKVARTRPRTPRSRSATSAGTPRTSLDKLVKDGEAGEDDVGAPRSSWRRSPRSTSPRRRPAQAQGSRAPRGLRPSDATSHDAVTTARSSASIHRSSRSPCSRSRRPSGAAAPAATCPRPSASASASAPSSSLSLYVWKAGVRRCRRGRRRARGLGARPTRSRADRVRVPVVPIAVGAVAIVVAGVRRRHRGRWSSPWRSPCSAPCCGGSPENPEGYVRDVTAGVFAAAVRAVPRRRSRCCCCVPTTAPTGSSSSSCSSVLSDVGGYAAGVLFGKHPMAPSVSPKKSWEGFAGSALSCAVGGAVSCRR